MGAQQSYVLSRRVMLLVGEVHEKQCRRLVHAGSPVAAHGRLKAFCTEQRPPSSHRHAEWSL